MPNSSTPLAVASNTDESTLARCADGSWPIVMRQVSAIDVFLPLLYSRSTDKGISWSTPAVLPGLGSAVKSIDPKLMLLPNGTMVLIYGRPDQRLAFSPDGSGYNWSTSIVTYTDANETCPTSANSAIVALEHNRLLQFGDYHGMTTPDPNGQGI
ncbi:MAG: exo-alpha-sialidase [Opitutaceae bacterium]|nr:exo-alpha-sialidase [Cytophagales bacterium]